MSLQQVMSDPTNHIETSDIEKLKYSSHYDKKPTLKLTQIDHLLEMLVPFVEEEDSNTRSKYSPQQHKNNRQSRKTDINLSENEINDTDTPDLQRNLDCEETTMSTLDYRMDESIVSLPDMLVIEKWIIVRRFGKRGGIKIPVPHSIEQLLEMGGEKLGIKPRKIREVKSEAEIDNIRAIKEDDIYWLMTSEDELKFNLTTDWFN